MPHRIGGLQKKPAGGDIFASMNEIMLILAEHLMEYVSILKRTEGKTALGNKQKA